MTEKQFRKALDVSCKKLYLEYVNDYLTIDFMSIDKNISVNALRAMIDHGRKLFNKN